MTDLGFVFAAGEEKYDDQGLYLARSIERTNPDASVYVYVPDGESPAHERELDRRGTLLRGPPSVPEYGISRKIDALRLAEDVADEPYLLLLDTDTLVFERITVHDSGAELYLKPVDVGRQFWGRRSQSAPQWEKLAAEIGVPTPTWTHRSTFDDVAIPPYWNAGFVLTATNGFGARWMDVTERLYPDLPYEWHADQVALGLLSQEYDVEPVDNRYNYPLHLRLRLPSDVAVAHYHNFHNLKKCPERQAFLEAIDLWEAVRGTDHSKLRSVWRYCKRKRLPLNETHLFERLYNRVRG